MSQTATSVRSVATPTRVRVGVLDQRAAERAKVKGMLLRVGRADGVTSQGTVNLSVDYRAFATGYGADWASRLRLISLPACALQTPDRPECAGSVLPTRNDLAQRTVTATVPVEPQVVADRGIPDAAWRGALLALAAGTSGAAGDYGATSLSPSATWSAGSSSGDFTWSYPMRNPPGLNGPTPEMKLNYSAQSVDGRHAASNNQPSWVGEGFEFVPGDFIERRYRSCGQDMDGPDNNNATKTGDLCWETQNATMSLGGAGGELIHNATDGYWHLRRDDGTRAERIVGGANYGNGDNDGEYWKVTTTDGTQYFFGRHKLAGWTTDKPVTNSTWTVPVFGNDPGEPCRGSTFASSDCMQAWRWNLDYVIDPHGNTMSLWYTKESNGYARNNAASDVATYTRGGYLTRIDYGTDNRTEVGGVRTDSLYRGVAAPMRVNFAVADRCLADCTNHDGVHWPDTPWDQECTGSSCLIGAPTFWSKKRLSAVTTQVRDGSAYRNVERWTLTHTFPDPGDGTRAGLFLKNISHEGLVGIVANVPDIEFTGTQLSNRVDTNDHSAAMNWWRLAMIRSETGGTVNINYSAPDCVAGTRMPSAAHSNTLRCYPVRWTPEGYPGPVTDWFHKYVVTTIYETDHTGGMPPAGSPRTSYSYSYLGNPAWRYADDDGLIGKKDKSWSVWRGYERVGVTVGDPGEQTYVETKYFRGMHGDKQPSGTRNVSVTGTGVPTVNDEDSYAGLVREKTVYNGPGGAVVSREVSEPWQSAPTASRTINGDLVEARFVDVSGQHNRVTLDAGRGERVTSQYTTFNADGLPIQVDERGDTAKTGDEQCVKIAYANNTTNWLIGLPHTRSTFAVRCADATNPATLTADQVVSVDRISYDGNAHGTAPTRGEVTRNEQISGWTAGSSSFATVSRAAFDAYGRVVETWDAMNLRSTTGYTPATGGPLTRTVVTNPLGHTVTSDLEPGWGLATRVTDPNAKITDLSYDGLGRLKAVWNPGRDKATDPANVTYDYLIRANAPSVITTRALNPAGNYVTAYALYDGLLRKRQTQAASPSGGRLLTDTFYDTAGREVRSYGVYHTTGTPGTTLVTATDAAFVPNQMRTEYDGAGRATASIFQPYGAERYRTRTYYAGDRVDTTPPAGGTVTSKVGDALGRTVELRQYHGTTPTGPYDSTTYRYNAKGQQDRITDPAGNQWTFGYDIRGRQEAVHDPDKGLTTLTYDNADRVTSATNALNQKLVHVYDPLGRKLATFENELGGTLRAQWVYDTLAKGQLTQSTRMVGSAPYQVRVTGYTDGYQPTGTQVIVPASETGLAGTYNINSTYNVDGSMASQFQSETGDLPAETLRYHYDPVSGLPKQLTTLYGTAPASSYVADTDYNALGKVDQYEMYTGLYSETGSRLFRSFTYELESGRLTGNRTDRDSVAPHIISDVRYDYDKVGNIVSMSDLAAAGGADHQCFQHDYRGQLRQAWTPGNGDCDAAPAAANLGGPAKYWLAWDIDAAGRRLQQVDRSDPATERVTSYTYGFPVGSGSRPHALNGTSTEVNGVVTNTASYTYDAAGNTLTRPTATAGTQTLTWDPEGLLATSTDSTGTTSYIYDADGNRLIRKDPTGKTLYLPGQELRYRSSDGALTCTRYYSFNGQQVASRTAAGLVWLASDHQGTAQVSVNEGNQQFTVRRQTPYGTPRGGSPAWPNSKGFVGGTADNTGLVHLGAREYDPVIGRFVSVDPVFNEDAPEQMNGYAYSANSPVTHSDPTGREPGGSWMYVGSNRWTSTNGGYRYHYRADYYLFCRYGGSQCLGGVGNTPYWIPMQYAGQPGVWLVARVVLHVWRVALNIMGPVAGPASQPKPRVQIPTTPSCPPAPMPQEPKGELDGPKCEFFDFKCLFSGGEGAKKWWRGNRDWVTGTVGTIGVGVCIVATAGVCAVAGAVGLGVALTGRALDVASSESGWTQDNVERMFTGMAIDYASSKIPGVRLFKTTRSGATVYVPQRSFRNPTRDYSLTWQQQFKPGGTWDRPAARAAGVRAAGQGAWWMASAPGPIAPWQQGIPITDPLQW
ncbi:RHS repeat-associated core domain-containing protein [Solwaraspora sp. WMMA2065]|uniref:RHS repeat-associated core domain-containing protein n=1 Tax=Solwaraspora sp. WMMA2065 TaxID=3015166 RepID=UPI00259B32B1|nr:RHS repeat-associated core domain-containing protein [Solwaraspora sp. WMMA2065]WJK35492.1 RHS repeat-associated core domain-containing protein [Solwaraspora sp. WMMA2065]